MRHFSFLLMLIAIGLIAISCSHDEPEYYNQEATGETFIENGVLVKANTDFSTEMLTYALSKHEWKRVSIFYYDGKNVSDKVTLPGAPLYIHKNGTVEYISSLGEGASIRQYTVNEKQLTVTMKDRPWWSDAYYFDEVYTVVSVDLKKNSGRIIMDRDLSGSIDGLDFTPTHERSVWNYAD